MSTPVSQHHLPDSPDAPSAPPPPSSPFLLPLRTLAAAAASNPNLKLKSPLLHPLPFCVILSQCVILSLVGYYVFVLLLRCEKNSVVPTSEII